MTDKEITRVGEYFRRDDRWYALYRCHCGREWEVRSDRIETGKTKGCGCHKSNQIME